MKLSQREPKTGVIRARCEKELENGLVSLALVRRLDLSDLIREALWDYYQKARRKQKPGS